MLNGRWVPRHQKLAVEESTEESEGGGRARLRSYRGAGLEKRRGRDVVLTENAISQIVAVSRLGEQQQAAKHGAT